MDNEQSDTLTRLLTLDQASNNLILPPEARAACTLAFNKLCVSYVKNYVLFFAEQMPQVPEPGSKTPVPLDPPKPRPPVVDPPFTPRPPVKRFAGEGTSQSGPDEYLTTGFDADGRAEG